MRLAGAYGGGGCGDGNSNSGSTVVVVMAVGRQTLHTTTVTDGAVRTTTQQNKHSAYCIP